MPQPKPITAAILTADVAPPASTVHHVRIVVSVNNAITLFRVWVEGEIVPKWTPKSGFLVWENKQQPVQGTLDVVVEAWGGPKGLLSLATVCDERQVGQIDLDTTSGHAAASESYDV
jgi:hypothetical protein